ncbi:MAG: hypothetical protein ACR2LA_08835 [Acidimicrobiales bacterium]
MVDSQMWTMKVSVVKVVTDQVPAGGPHAATASSAGKGGAVVGEGNGTAVVVVGGAIVVVVGGAVVVVVGGAVVVVVVGGAVVVVEVDEGAVVVGAPVVEVAAAVVELVVRALAAGSVAPRLASGEPPDALQPTRTAPQSANITIALLMSRPLTVYCRARRPRSPKRRRCPLGGTVAVGSHRCLGANSARQGGPSERRTSATLPVAVRHLAVVRDSDEDGSRPAPRDGGGGRRP